MGFNCKLCEALAVVGKISPVVIADTPVFGDEIEVALWDELLFVFMLGAVDKTVDCSVYEDTDGAATSAQSLKALTQLSAADDNKIGIINIKRSELSTGFYYVRPRIVCGASQAAPLSCVVLGSRSKLLLSDRLVTTTKSGDLTAVAEIND